MLAVAGELASGPQERVVYGTTTATLLAHAIFAEGARNIAAGASAIDLKRRFDRALIVAIEAVRTLSRPVES